MMHIDVLVPSAFHGEANATMFAKEVQHMVEERGSGIYRTVKGGVEIEHQLDVRLLGFPFYFRFTHAFRLR
jgi:hypothetical protein